MKKYFILLVLGIFTCTSCEKEEDSQEEELQVEIRLYNNSSRDFSEIQVNNISYPRLNSGEYSDYKVFGEAYRYAYIKLYAGGTEYILQPYDYVGEVPLQNGKYTYSLSLNEAGNNIEISLIKEK